MKESSLFEQIGGRPSLEKVHKIFYDKIYDHPLLKAFFVSIEQKVIEDQQTNFMTSNMGGGKIYVGKAPKSAHKHMFITNELFNLRSELLKQSINECGIPYELQKSWMKIDSAFRHSMVKSNLSDCEKRFSTDEIMVAPEPK